MAKAPPSRHDGGVGSSLRTPVCAAIVYLTIGGNFLGFRMVVDTVPPFVAATARALLGGLLLLAVVALVRRMSGSLPKQPTAGQMRASAVQATLLLVGGQGSVAWGVQHIPAGTAAILSSSMPIWVAIFSRVWIHRSLSRVGVLGVAVGFVGLAVLAFARDDGGIGMSGAAIVPALVVLAGAASTAAGVLYGQRGEGHPDGLFGAALQLTCAGLILGVLALGTGEFGIFTPAAVPARSWAALAYLVLFGSVIGYSALVWLTEQATPALTASIAYVGPIVALALSAWLLGEHVGVAKTVAAVLALAGAALMAREGKSPKPRPNQATGTRDPR